MPARPVINLIFSETTCQMLLKNIYFITGLVDLHIYSDNQIRKLNIFFEDLYNYDYL